MAKVDRFWDLKVWKAARVLNQQVYQLILRNDLVTDNPLKDQVNRSAGSIMDNIAEGFGRSGRKEFIQFLSYSKGSCDEFQSQLHRCVDRNYLTKDEFTTLFEQSDSVASMIVGFSKYLQKTELPGNKYIVEESSENYEISDTDELTIKKLITKNLNSNPKLKTQNPKPQTPNSKLKTQNPKPQTQNSKP